MRPRSGAGRSRAVEEPDQHHSRLLGGPHPEEHLDDQVLRALHDCYAGELYSFALRLSNEPQRAEEAVQDALLRAWQHPEALDGSQGSSRAWLYTVVRNSLRDSWRRDAVRPRNSSLENLDTISSSDEIDRVVETWGVAEAVNRLSDVHREILYYSYFLSLSVDETAAALHIAAGTVKSRTYYALRALRATLEEMGYVK